MRSLVKWYKVVYKGKWNSNLLLNILNIPFDLLMKASFTTFWFISFIIFANSLKFYLFKAKDSIQVLYTAVYLHLLRAYIKIYHLTWHDWYKYYNIMPSISVTMWNPVCLSVKYGITSVHCRRIDNLLILLSFICIQCKYSNSEADNHNQTFFRATFQLNFIPQFCGCHKTLKFDE